MKSWANENDSFWESSVPSFNLDEHKSKNYEGLKQFSCRSTKPAPAPVNSPQLKNYQSAAPLSFSIKAESDLQSPALICHACNNIIDDTNSCKYEGDKVFTNEGCWKHWINNMVQSGDIRIEQLLSLASKKYCLERITNTCNGQLTLKITLALKGSMKPYDFGILLCDNQMACNHYMAFLKETRQNDDKILRCKYELEYALSELREIFLENSQVKQPTVSKFIILLSEFRDERLLSPGMVLQCEMITEYINLLSWQLNNNPEFINAPLIETLVCNNVSYRAIKDLATAKYLKDLYKLTAEEFVWTSIKSIVDEKKVNDIDNVVNHKVMGNRPDVTFQRIVSYLVFLDREPDEIKMKCLSKISDIHELIDCANMWKLLPAYMEYCKRNKDNSQLKKIQQITQGKK